MRRSLKQVFQGLFAAAAVASVLLSPALAAEKTDFKVAWSIYVGWVPWGYAAESGIVKLNAFAFSVLRISRSSSGSVHVTAPVVASAVQLSPANFADSV